MKRYIATLLGCAAIIGGCREATGVPDLNNPSYQGFLGTPLTRASLQNAITGIVDGQRAELNGTPATFIVFSETMARDAYRTDASEPRYINEFLNGTPDPSAFSGGGLWTLFFGNVRAENTLLTALPNAAAGEFTDAEKTAIRGFTKTLKAWDFLYIIEMRDTIGAPIDVDRPVDAELAPIICKPGVLTYISALLDTAQTDLAAGGSTFPFRLPAGYAGFTTPLTFMQVNRALKAKVELYRALDHQAPTGAAGFTNAITALNSSFLTLDPAALATGIYFVYSTASGDRLNTIATDQNLHLNPQVSDSLEPGDRRGAKIRAITPATILGVTYKSNFVSASSTAPIAQLKNEELILLRAQAKIGLNDLPGAWTDINFVRQNSGGLPPRPLFVSQAQAIDALLDEKRYSLLFESAHRLVDLRAYGRLNETYFVKERPGDVYVKALPIPQGEANARNGVIACQ